MTDPFSAPDESRPRAARKAEFTRFHDQHYATMVGLLHALSGDRTHAHRVTQRAFTDAWLRWRAVRTLPDPAAWVRRRARHAAPPRRRPAGRASGSGEWVAPLARPIFDALRELPEKQRVVLALHHVGGLTPEQIAAEEQIPLDAVTARLAHAHQALAQETGQAPAELGNGDSEHQSVDAWAGRGLADLTHALSYRTDRRAGEQVFRLAIRRRLAVFGAAVVLLALVGAIGALALSGGSRNAASPPPAPGEPLASLPAAPPPVGSPGEPPAAAGQPAGPGSGPAPARGPAAAGSRTGEPPTGGDHDGDGGDHDQGRDPNTDGARNPFRPTPVVNATPRPNPGHGGGWGHSPGGSAGQPPATGGIGNDGNYGSGGNPRGPRTEQGGSDKSDNADNASDNAGNGNAGDEGDNSRGDDNGRGRGGSGGGERGSDGRDGSSGRSSESGKH